MIIRFHVKRSSVLEISLFMSKIRIFALCWLVFILAFFLGWQVYDSKIWPYGPLMEIKDFVVGGSAENLSLLEKIENDLNIKPTRHLSTDGKGPGDWVTASKGHVSPKHWELTGMGLSPQRKNPKIFLSKNAPRGYRLIYGTFCFDDKLHGAVLLDSQAKVARVWRISQEGFEKSGPKDTNVFPHGFAVAPDGSFAVCFDGGNSLIKYDYCGQVVWRVKGLFSHSIHFEGEDAIWVWKDRGKGKGWRDLMVKMDYQTGKLLKSISVHDIMEANRDIDVFAIRQEDTVKSSEWVGDYWHPNDIEPLPEKLAGFYPGFSAGDLLVSLRSVNLIFVMDQNSLEIKWWRQGLARRQHDPDFNDRGTITIFNNNMHRDYSNIMEINPSTYEHRVILDGEKYNFYTWWRGKHQMMPDGGVLITSPSQGRVFETDASGNVTFEFLNIFGEDKEKLAISEAMFLPEDYFKELPSCP